MAIIAQPGLTPFINQNGKPLVGGKLYFYDAGTSTPKTIYADADLTVPLSNPLTADEFGVFTTAYVGVGSYRIRITTKGGAIVRDVDNLPGESTASSGGGSSGSSSFPVGSYLPIHRDQPVDGWVRANGRTIGNDGSGATERANADTEALYTVLWETDAGRDLLTVSTGKGANAAADFAAGKTITLPDTRGRSPIGTDDMGTSDAGRLSVSTTISTTNASATATLASVTGVYIGMYVISANVPTGTVISNLVGATATLSQAATATATGTACRLSEFREPKWLGTTAGRASYIMTVTEMPSHSHTASASVDGAHTHSGGADAGGNHIHSAVTDTAPDHSHSYSGVATGTSTGTGGPITVMFSGSNTTGGAGSHSHTVTVSASGDHTHNLTINSSGSHTHTITVQNNGSGRAFSTISPSFTVGWYMKL